jgi:hypothetical protein
MRQDSRQAQPWGLVDASDTFIVRMWAATPAGRGRIKLEVEACPPGAAFGDADCISTLSSSWHDTVPTGGYPPPKALWVPVTGLEPDTLYRWRARVLYAPYSVTKASITPPAHPAHGPWRRFLAQGMEADLRTLSCSYGLAVAPASDTGTGNPGETVSYALNLTNNGTCSDTVDGVASDHTWITDLSSPVGPIVAGGDMGVTVTVQIPADVTAGASDSATITFTSQSDPGQSTSSILTTEVTVPDSNSRIYLPLMVR